MAQLDLQALQGRTFKIHTKGGQRLHGKLVGTWESEVGTILVFDGGEFIPLNQVDSGTLFEE